MVFGDFHAILYDTSEDDDALNYHVAQVDPGTIGGCTGSKDKSGKLIFEGDILRSPRNEYLFIVVWDGNRWLAITTLEKPSLARPHIQRYLMPVCSSDDGNPTRSEVCEIFGNIHNNPELLEAEG